MSAFNVMNYFMQRVVLICNKKAANTDRRGCKRGHERQTEKMLVHSQCKFPPVNVDNNVVFRV